MSTQIEITNKIVNYLQETGYRRDNIVDALVSETKSLGNVSRMQIAPEQGQLLQIIIKISKSKLCLEIGRFTGLSTLYMARGLPSGGKVKTIDNSDEFLPIALKHWKSAGLHNKIETVNGNALEVMQNYIDKNCIFDLIFIDADKNNYDNYYELSLKLVNSNGIIIIDNMLWGGDVVLSSANDEQTKNIRQLNKKIQNDNRVQYSLLPLSDGISFVIKK
ncbi:MAG: putative O-methyltransferase [Alphaproteobacteria bacterium MarineAlpha5_Bin11]|nr:SAM-dependent methyltransferase [Pelagibacteraceae bacterium]PPR44570.1 MAG: putative O-methyltransferase [Alphaproteobacteria bacterium MarineAlpha5_Bin11]PPR50866.1 MAG: putative O-methyltransferase [Alphaproteobacteria bacterium MarineAlpha5_Bin10]|tara:strand:+ start:1018 stop:1674 length:657 start_codon:yes stop_codon:yes gene_type:complete